MFCFYDLLETPIVLAILSKVEIPVGGFGPNIFSILFLIGIRIKTIYNTIYNIQCTIRIALDLDTDSSKKTL